MTHHADEAELLGEHREQEIGVRLGQVEQLLHAASPSPTPNHSPRPMAISDCVSWKPLLNGSVPGVEERR